MNRFIRAGVPCVALVGVALLLGGAGGNSGCASAPSSNDIQRDTQARVTGEAVREVGVPSIINFREMRQLKDIYELRDQNGLVTYTYLFPEMTGKPIFFCDSIGYGIPYATEFSAGESMQHYSLESSTTTYSGAERLPQAEPNGLFPPSSADGTWVLCREPGGKNVRPQYVEPKVLVTTFPLPGVPTQ
jgi:hypothetical protein